MADERVTVSGLDELVAGSRRLFRAIDKRAKREVVRVAQQRARLASARIPRRTGHMAQSVAVDVISDGASVGISRSEVPYAGWVEFGGTRGRPYVPGGRYLVPTALAAESDLKGAGDRAAKDEIRGFPWPKPKT